MTSGNKNKLNQLLKLWPSGMPITHNDLKKMHIYQQLVSCYVKSGWLEPLGRGAFKKAGDQVNWLDALTYIQTNLHKPVHLAAKTALEFAGVQHFYHPNTGTPVWLFGQTGQRLPAWFLSGDTKRTWGRTINYLTPTLFLDDTLGLSQQHLEQYVQSDSKTLISSLERAMLESLYLVPKLQSLEEAKYLMEGLVTLRPKLLQKLLEQCTSIKVKRLFLFLADFCQLPCFKHLDVGLINLGSGKRVIGTGGYYIGKYKLSLPKKFVNTFHEEFLKGE